MELDLQHPEQVPVGVTNDHDFKDSCCEILSSDSGADGFRVFLGASSSNKHTQLGPT